MKMLKRILAIICIVALVAMYGITLVMAIFDNSATMTMFKGCVLCTIFIPIVAYAYIALHKYAMLRSGRKNYFDDTSADASSDSDV